ncbi:MAG: hypothetical protein PWQ61_1541 [Betaproteobacteria bacterium]|nr:hypothetical protein [Betaproteobacteria bacterium]
MTGPDLTPESVKRRFDDETINKAKTFRTLGVGRQAALNYLDTPQGTKYLEQLLDASPNLTNDELQSRAIGQIASGRELPRIEINSDPLFKIVPKGSQPSQHSPFWAKEADLNAAVNGGKNLSDHFALPVASESPRYDVYRITPKAPAEAFVNTVAPTSELDGLVKKTGGARQYLTPNRNLYEPAELVRSVDNRLHVPLKGTTAVRPTIKAAGVLGTAYGAYDAKDQVDAAIDTARSTREQWVRGAEESANQASKTVVTGAAATVGAVPGAAAGALTSPVTGPAGPVLGGLATGGAAAYGADKLYEESRLQQFSKYLGRQAGDLGYDYLSREGRLLRQVNGLRQDLGEAQDPAERARLQGRLDQASAAFHQEAERNNRYFEGREIVDQVWEKMHARIPRVDKDDVQAALARHIDAGKRPGDAVRGAFSDAVHARYPRTLDHEPLENYRALSNTQLTDRYRQYQGEVVQDERTVQALRAHTQSHNDLDQGWPKALAERRQSERLESALNEQWRDRGHLKAIGEAMRERGMSPPVTLSPAQQRYHQQAQEQIGPGLRRMGVNDEQIDRVTAAAVSHAQSRAQGAPVQAFHLSKDGERVAMIGPAGSLSEFRVSEALSQAADQHLAQAHANAHANESSHRPDPSQSQTPAAPPMHEPPVMAR